MQIIVAFISGAIMSFGLIISGMANPRKVIGFLDVSGQFDPTLMFVMAGALIVAGIGFRLARRRSQPVFSAGFDAPVKQKVDAPLIFGSAVFGLGWGLAGFCPGPALVGIGLGETKAVVFVAAMIVGMLSAKFFTQFK
jgi:uncharacterized membrane protein YedE/YeeE